MESFSCHYFEPGMLLWHCVFEQNHFPSHTLSQCDTNTCSLHNHIFGHSHMCLAWCILSQDTCHIKNSTTCGIFLWLRCPHKPLVAVQHSGDVSGCQGDDHTRHCSHPNLLLPEANVSRCPTDHCRSQHTMLYVIGGVFLTKKRNAWTQFHLFLILI